MTESRGIRQIVQNVEQSEGDGARVRRSIGGREIRNLDPFLLLDEFSVSPPAGFPPHPHRGFETVTYMIDGKFRHEDFCGHQGVIGPGALQWMTAGRGIVHLEMPETATTRGLQLWVNLKKENKMVEPKYQELEAKEVATIKNEAGTVVQRVIAGVGFDGKTESVVRTLTPTVYYDVKVSGDGELKQAINKSFNAFLYILDGVALIGDEKTRVEAHHTVLFDNGGDHVRVLSGDSSKELHFVLIGGEPLNEPIVQHGPFVMNTRAEIQEAITDFSNFQNGFEKRQSYQFTL